MPRVRCHTTPLVVHGAGFIFVLGPFARFACCYVLRKRRDSQRQAQRMDATLQTSFIRSLANGIISDRRLDMSMTAIKYEEYIYVHAIFTALLRVPDICTYVQSFFEFALQKQNNETNLNKPLSISLLLFSHTGDVCLVVVRVDLSNKQRYDVHPSIPHAKQSIAGIYCCRQVVSREVAATSGFSMIHTLAFGWMLLQVGSYYYMIPPTTRTSLLLGSWCQLYPGYLALVASSYFVLLYCST